MIFLAMNSKYTKIVSINFSAVAFPGNFKSQNVRTLILVLAQSHIHWASSVGMVVGFSPGVPLLYA